MWIKNDFFKYGVSFLLVTAIIFMLGQIEFFLAPFKQFVAVLFFPIILSAAFYYMSRPVVRGLCKLKFPKTLAIILVFFAAILVITLVIAYAGNLAVEQAQSLLADLPQMLDAAKSKAQILKNNQNFASIYRNNVEGQVSTLLQSFVPSMSDGIKSGLSALANIASIFIVIPFILFYMLKDDRIFYQKLCQWLPHSYREDAVSIIKETDKTLSTYIIGQAIIAFILGLLTFLGYVVIGLKYAFILALFVCITSFIPMFGVVLGIIPALAVGFSQNPLMMVKIMVVCLFVQQIEGNFVSPYVIGKRLDLHPLTIIIIFMVAASLYGFVGMLLAVPVYAVFKVIVTGVWKIRKVSRG